MEHFPDNATLQNGFAIAVASFLLLRTDKRLEELKNAVLHLANVLESGKKRSSKSQLDANHMRAPPLTTRAAIPQRKEESRWKDIKNATPNGNASSC